MDLDTIVASGAALLDGYGPVSWRNRIHPGYIDMADAEHCVAGQVFGGFWNAPRVVHLHPAFGVEMCSGEAPDQLEELGEAWRRYLTPRYLTP